MNGMAIGGKRRFTIDPELVCYGVRPHPLLNPIPMCGLTGPDDKGNGTAVRKEKLIVEATLTESCIPQVRVLFSGPMGMKTKLVGCRRPDYPKRDPNLPIWHLY